MNRPLIIRRQIHLRQVHGNQPTGQDLCATAGRVPRVARLLALAIHIDQLIELGELADYAQLARRVHLSRARIAQVVKLRFLTPDLQETILFLPPVRRGADPITERDLRPIAAQVDWRRQRQMWARLIGRKRQS